MEWRQRRIAEGKAPSTISNAMNVLSAIYKQAITEWGYRLTNPLLGVKRPKPNQGREAFLDAADEKKLLDACSRGPTWLIWCVRVALATAMRAGEIRRLEWAHVHEDDGWVHLPVTKNDTKRDVPLISDDAVAIFREIRQALPQREDGRVFGDPAKPLAEGGFTVWMLTYAFAKAVSRAGIPRITFHDLRHVATTRLAPVHRDAVDLSKTTGHKTLQVLARYYNEKPGDRVRRLRQRATEG